MAVNEKNGSGIVVPSDGRKCCAVDFTASGLRISPSRYGAHATRAIAMEPKPITASCRTGTHQRCQLGPEAMAVTVKVVIISARMPVKRV